MSPHQNNKNVPIPRSFPDTIRLLRTERLYTKADLSEASGLSIRTIQDLEAGRKSRIQEKTLLLLAEALQVEPAVLLADGDELPLEAEGADQGSDAAQVGSGRPPDRRRTARLAATALIVLAAAAAFTWHWSRTHGAWSLEDGRVTVRDAFFGSVLWDSGDSRHIQNCIDSPWDSRHLIVGIRSTAKDGPRLLCLERADADTVWAVSPDLDAAVDAFGPDDVYAAGFGCRSLETGDIDGDGIPEVVAGFQHGLYYPYAICVIDRRGTMTSQYLNRGHMYRTLVTDLDNDGRDEILATGTNNVPSYNGATVILLDEAHRRGASVDSLAPPWRAAVDSSLVRLVMPQFPQQYMDFMGMTRLSAKYPLLFRNPRDEVLINIRIGDNRSLCMLVVCLDTDLCPLNCIPEDDFREHIRAEWPDSLWVETGPLEPAWRSEWLSRAVRFGAGVSE